MLKKLTVFSLLISLLITSTYAISSDPNPENRVDTVTISEYEIVLQQEEEFLSTHDQMSTYGQTNQVTGPLQQYKEAFDARANLSKKELQDLGYSEEEIRLLNEYKSGTKSFEEVAPRVAASLSTLLSCSTYTPTKYVVRYTWQWDKAPKGLDNDVAVLALQGINSSSNTFDIKIDRKVSKVNYYVAGEFEKTETPTLSFPSSDSSVIGAAATYDKYKLTDNKNDWMWAKDGYLEVTVSPTVSGVNTFSAVRARGEMLITSGESNSSITINPYIVFMGIEIGIKYKYEIDKVTVENMGGTQKVFKNNGTYILEF